MEEVDDVEGNSTAASDQEIAVKEEEAPTAMTVPIKYDNPRGWSGTRKIIINVAMSNMVLSLTFSSSAYASSVTNIMAHYHVSRVVALLGVSLYVLGFALGPLLVGPLSQVVGKRPVYLATFVCFTAFSFGAAEAPNIAALIVFRFLAGAMGSSAFNNVPATIFDFSTPATATRYMNWFAFAAFGGPGLGPTIAGFVDHRAGFRWNLRVQAIYIAFSTIVCYFFVPETHHPILQRRAAEEDEKNRTGQVAVTMSARQSVNIFLTSMKTVLRRPFVWLVKEPAVAVTCFYLSLLYGVLYAFFPVFPLVFTGIRKFSEESTGLSFLALVIGFTTAFLLLFVLQEPYIARLAASSTPKGKFMPEARLRQALWGCTLPPIGLFIFAWTAPFPHVHWIAPMIGMTLYALGMMIMFTALIPYLVDYGGPEAALVMAASSFTRSAFAAGFPLFTVQMYDAMTVQGATSLLAGITLLLMPLPWFLHRYGSKLRANSRMFKT